MKIVNINVGQETGGALTHLIFLSKVLNDHNIENVLLLFENGTVAKAAQDAGLNYKVIDQKNTQEWINYLNDQKFDFVQTHGPRANFLVSLHRKKIKPARLVTVHSDPRYDFMGGGLKGKLQTKLNIWSLKQADGIFVISKDLKNVLTSLGIKGEKIFPIDNAMEFSPTVASKQDHDFMNMILVARLHPVKEHARLIKAIKEVDNKKIHLHLVGDGSLRASLEELVEENELSDQIKFYGALKQDQIDELYRKMDLALLVSKSEAFGMVFLEAANCEVPMLMTELSASKEMIPNEEQGIVVENSQAGIVEGIKKAYQLGEKNLVEMGKRSRVYAIEKFGPNAFYKQIESGYTLFSKNKKP